MPRKGCNRVAFLDVLGVKLGTLWQANTSFVTVLSVRRAGGLRHLTSEAWHAA